MQMLRSTRQAAPPHSLVGLLAAEIQGRSASIYRCRFPGSRTPNNREDADHPRLGRELAWLDLTRPEAELLRPLPDGSLEVKQVR
jgi:hypothetical protein